MLDPIADKILVGVALMMLVAEVGRSSIWPSKLLSWSRADHSCARDSGFGPARIPGGSRVSVPVSRIAKLKTTIQMIAIGAMILGPLADGFVPGTLASAYRPSPMLRCGWRRRSPSTPAISISAPAWPMCALQAPRRRAGVTLLYFAWVRQKTGAQRGDLRTAAGHRTPLAI